MPKRYIKKGGTKKGRPPRLTHYEPGKLGLRGFRIGQRCMTLWRHAIGVVCLLPEGRWHNRPRPWAMRPRIISAVMKEFGETYNMVETLWDEYRYDIEPAIKRDADKSRGE